ncbi:MAG TPA: YihY/virulence factor BrkB family protein [Acidobacteriaceae bacterium]|nr:YihY/virulence factor BrkB family protein [Acidobacteriaceae bacterium]
MDVKRFTALFRTSFNDFNKHNDPRMGAALAFYTIGSMSPLVILVLAIASLIFNRNAAEAQLLDKVQSMVGPQGRQSVATILAHGHHVGSGIFSAIIGVVVLFLGASGVFQELRSGLNTIWESEAKPASGLRGMVRERILTFGMVLSLGFVLLVSLLVSSALQAISSYFSGLLPIPAMVLEFLNALVSFAGIALLFACILKYVPATRVDWRDVRVGAVVTALLFTLGKWLLGIYLGKTSPGAGYGAAGSLVVLVVWVYYSSQIFYLGAEFTHVHSLANRGKLQVMPSGEAKKAA